MEVIIEKMVYGGMGLARTDSGIVFVNGSIPGERVRIGPVTKKAGSAAAHITEVLEKSSDRRDPPCQYAHECGGCDWLFIEPQRQTSIKREIFLECLDRTGKIRGAVPPVEIIAAGESAYRLRAQIKIDRAGVAGFYKSQSDEVVQIEHCMQLVEPLNRLLRYLAGNTDCGKALRCGNVRVIAGDDGTVAADPLIDGQTQREVIIGVRDKRFTATGDSFFQSNRTLIDRLGVWGHEDIGGKLCVDLYGGTGFFSVMHADRFTRGILIESVDSQVAWARNNLGSNGIENWEALVSPAEKILSVLHQKIVDTMIVDPPRPGLSPVVREAIAKIKPGSLLYVSCNPSTQARDLGYFVNQAGYRIERAALFDLYPNTHHIETAVLLRC